MKFIRDIISEKRAQAAEQAAVELDEDHSTYVLTPERAVNSDAFEMANRAQDNAYSMIEDDEPESIFGSDGHGPDLAEVMSDAPEETPQLDDYDLDFDDLELANDAEEMSVEPEVEDDVDSIAPEMSVDDDTEVEGKKPVEEPNESANIFAEEELDDDLVEDSFEGADMKTGWTG
ncbi:MAG: hypothetical protein AB3N11_03900, partial [Arenibacterium sp.]